MTYRGRVQNGVVVFDDGAPLAEGTPVRIEPEASPAPSHASRGEELIRFQHLIDPESLREMSEAIERDCGKVDENEW